MRYAIIENGIVVNVTSGSKLNPSWVFCNDSVVIGDTYSGGSFKKAIVPDAPPPEPTPAPAWEWFIDLGPFFDRFGTAKMAVLTSTDAAVKAILTDVQIRKWVDLKRADVAQSLGYIGSVVAALTPEIQASILTTPVTAEENLALRKLYF